MVVQMRWKLPWKFHYFHGCWNINCFVRSEIFSSCCVFVRVFQGETSVASATSCPVWNEEISFIEQFPPLAQRIGIQILDDAKMGDVALATHFLDLQQISDPTRNGTTRSLHMLSDTIHSYFLFTLIGTLLTPPAEKNRLLSDTGLY